MPLGAVVGRARALLPALLALPGAPELVVVAGREFEQGTVVGPGRPLDDAELATIVVGDRMPDDRSDFFHVDIPATGDGVQLMVMDHDPEVVAYLSPYRTCVGVVVGVGLALAVAQVSGGRYVDGDIGMVGHTGNDAGEVLARTRLREPGTDFEEQCVRYVRQFAHLNGWPRDRSMRS